MNSHFDKAAKTWDMKPERLERAKRFADEILKCIDDMSIHSAMEFGAGTGAVSFYLKDRIPSIVLVDSSEGMIRELQKKIERSSNTRMQVRKLDLIQESYPDKHDLIYTLMALHHIVPIEKILKVFFDILRSGAMLVIGDLVTEDGSFHDRLDDFHGHHGFDPNQLSDTLHQIGYRSIRHRLFEVTKKIIQEKEKEFPLFLLCAVKP